MMTKKIVLCSWGQIEGNNSNMGDKLIFETQLELLRNYHENLSIFCMSGDPAYTKNTYSIEAANPFTVKGFFTFIHYIRLCDLVIIGGGELIQDRSSQMYLLFNLFPVWIAKLFRKKCIALGIGINSRNELSLFGKILARSLSLLDACGIRDETSFENAKDFHIKHDKLFLSSDIVFLSDRYKDPENNNLNLPIMLPDDYIVVSLRDITGRKGGLLPSSIKRKFSSQKIEDNKHLCDILNLFIKALDAIITEKDMKIILWPTYCGKSFSGRDDAIHQYIYEHISRKENVQKIDIPMTYEQIFKLLRNARLLIGVPLHSLIMATIAHCPFIGIIHGEKSRNFIRQLNYSENWTYSLTGEEGDKTKGTHLYNTMSDILKNESQIKMELKKNQEKLKKASRVNSEILNRFLNNDYCGRIKFTD